MIRVKQKSTKATGNSAKSEYRRRNPEKALAHRLVAKALKAGCIARPHNCEGCGRTADQVLVDEGKELVDKRKARVAARVSLGERAEGALNAGLRVDARRARGLVLSANARHLIQYHHEDYARPFWIVALCPSCHRLIHREGPQGLHDGLPSVKMNARERGCRHFAMQEGVRLRGPVAIPCREADGVTETPSEFSI